MITLSLIFLGLYICMGIITFQNLEVEISEKAGIKDFLIILVIWPLIIAGEGE